MFFSKFRPEQWATLGALTGAGGVAIPTVMLVLTALLLLSSDATLLAKIAAPFLGALLTFVFGFWFYIPVSVLFGGVAYVFLKNVGYQTLFAYLVAGPVVGLASAMSTHFLAPVVIDALYADIRSGYAYVFAWCCGGTLLTYLFWTIRRPDRPWDDEADRRKASKLI